MPMIIVRAVLALLFLFQPLLGASAFAVTKEVGVLTVRATVSEICTTTKNTNGGAADRGLGVSVHCLMGAPFMVGLGAPQPAIASQLSALQGRFTLSSLRPGVVAVSITY